MRGLGLVGSLVSVIQMYYKQSVETYGEFPDLLVTLVTE